jgi:hypothetical protein
MNKEKPSVPDLKMFGKAGATSSTSSSSSSTTRSNRPLMTASKQLSINTITKVATITHTQEIISSQDKENYENLPSLPPLLADSKSTTTTSFPSLQQGKEKEKERSKILTPRPQPILSLTNKESLYYSSAEGGDMEDDDDDDDDEEDKELYHILEKLKNAQSSASLSKKRFKPVLSPFSYASHLFHRKRTEELIERGPDQFNSESIQLINRYTKRWNSKQNEVSNLNSFLISFSS